MALIIEDGTGLPDADSYINLEDADQFFFDRDVAEWIGVTDAKKEAGLRQGFDYLGLAFAYPGQPLATVQRGAWPRLGAYNRDGVYQAGVPAELRTAQLLLALESVKGKALLSAATQDPALASKSIQLPGLSINRSYVVGAQPGGLPRFPAVDAIMAAIATTRSSSGFRTQRLIRA